MVSNLLKKKTLLHYILFWWQKEAAVVSSYKLNNNIIHVKKEKEDMWYWDKLLSVESELACQSILASNHTEYFQICSSFSIRRKYVAELLRLPFHISWFISRQRVIPSTFYGVKPTRFDRSSICWFDLNSKVDTWDVSSLA